MKNTNKGAALPRRLVYGPTMTVVFDEDTTRPAVDAENARKIDRILDTLERQIKGDAGRKSPKESLEQAIREIKNKYDYVDELRRQGVNLTPEAIRRDYDAENPHMRKDGKFGYEGAEDRVTVPKSAFEKACAESESAYASRNPHKGTDKRPSAKAARDSARRPMSIYEEVEAAYVARNPHKKG